MTPRLFQAQNGLLVLLHDKDKTTQNRLFTVIKRGDSRVIRETELPNRKDDEYKEAIQAFIKQYPPQAPWANNMRIGDWWLIDVDQDGRPMQEFAMVQSAANMDTLVAELVFMTGDRTKYRNNDSRVVDARRLNL